MMSARKASAFVGVTTVVLLSAVAAVPSTAAAYASTDLSLSNQQAGELQSLVNKYPDAFAGMWADPTTRIVTVKLPSKVANESHLSMGLKGIRSVGTPADPDLSTGPKVWRGVNYVTGGPTMATLNALRETVPTAQPWASQVGTSLDAYYADPKLGKLVIEVDQVTPSLVSAAAATFGSLVQLQAGTKAHGLSRLLDSQPYFGGDSVANYGQRCTVGWEVIPYNSSHRGFLTAGHCWPAGDTIYQGYYSGGVLYKSGTMGQVTNRIYGNGLIDAAYVDATVTGTSISDVIFVTNTTTNLTHSAGTNFNGEANCWDGSVTNSNCNGIVQNANVCVVVDGVNTCGLVDDHSSNGSALGTHGDSGGPVYWYDGSGGLVALGTATAVSSTGTDYYYTDISFELSGLGVNIVTG